MALRTPDQIGGLLRLEPSNLTMQPYQRWVGAANPGPDRGAPTPGAEQSELLSCVMLSHVCVPILIHPSTNHECLSGGGDSCGSTHTLVTVHWIPCACNCGLVSSCVSPQSVRGVVGFAPLTDIYIAMLLGPDVPPWQMRWARRPGIAPPDTFGALSIATPKVLAESPSGVTRRDIR